jgi:hypothetical protein
MDTKPYFHLVFRPNIKLVSTVRRFTNEFYRRVLVDQSLAERLALATHELLENAVAYSSDGETSMRIEVDGDVLVIRTWNRTSAERLASVKKLIDGIVAAPDPEQYYQHLLATAAKRTEGSGLGLARVRSEAEMGLEYEVQDDQLCIRATSKIVGGLNP